MKYVMQVVCGVLMAGLTMIVVDEVKAGDCAELVHERTLAPLNELSTLGTDDGGFVTVLRHKDTSRVLFGVEVTKGTIITTSYQCDGQGHYRQLLDGGWSIWRTGKEFNAIHWMNP